MLFVLGIVLPVVGYRTSDRNLLPTAAIALILSGTLSGFMQDIVEGIAVAAK